MRIYKIVMDYIYSFNSLSISYYLSHISTNILYQLMVSGLYEPISHDFAPTIQAGRIPSDCRGAEAGDVDVGCFSGYTGGRCPP